MSVDMSIIMRVFIKIHIPNVYKKRKNEHNLRCLCKPCENFLISSLSLLAKSSEEEIELSGDRVDIAKGYNLNIFKNSIKGTM